MLREGAISSVPRFRAGLFSDLSAWDSYPLRILDFVELRVPPLISREKTKPSHQSLQKGFLSEQRVILDPGFREPIRVLHERWGV